ncbi:MAG: STAS domain-containing protein [Gammaproteobacteria bacterium]
MRRRAVSTESIEVREVSPGRIALRGPLEYETARHAHSQGLELITAAGASQLEIDCAGVTRSDSAALAVLTDWMATARERQLRLCVVNIPPDLRAIARISEVDELLERGVECGCGA